MQNAECRMQNNHIACRLPSARGNENTLRFISVRFLQGAAEAATELPILHSAF